MSQVLFASLVHVFAGISGIPTDSAGNKAIFPYHTKDADEEVPYPHITFARFGDITERGLFQDMPELATNMDGPRFAVCVWSKNSLDEAYPIYNAADTILRGPGSNVTTQYFSLYKVRRTHFRDDLFDDEVKAFHIHAEYSAWLQYPVAS